MVLPSDACRRRRREPERGVLHQVLRAHLESFLARARERDTGRGLPAFVVRELYRYLGCGLLAFGFARVRGAECGTVLISSQRSRRRQSGHHVAL